MKVLQIVPGETMRIVSAVQVDTPGDLVANPRERFAFQASKLRDVLKQGKFSGKRAVCSVSSESVTVEQIQLPASVTGKLADAVRLQMAGVMDRDASSVIVRHEEVGQVSRDGEKCTEVVCVGMPREIVLAHMKALKNAKLVPAGVLSEHHALAWAFGGLSRRANDSNRAQMYVDIGCGTTKVVITHGQKIAFARTIDLAGRRFDDVVVDHYKCSLANARQWRRSAEALNPADAEVTDTPLVAAVSGGTTEDIPLSEERRIGATPAGVIEVTETEAALAEGTGNEHEVAALRGVMESLAEEIAMCVRYHAALFRDRKISRVVFTGGESGPTFVCKRVSSMLGLPAELGDPFARLHGADEKRCKGFDFKRPQPGWTTALGLSMAPTDA